MEERKGTVTLPRFKLEYGDSEFVQILRSLGMSIAFSDDADFSPMLPSDPAKVDKVIHKAAIEADELGVKFAAATVVSGVRATVMRPTVPPFVFRADRPFFLALRDDESGVLLGLGRINKPIDPKNGKLESASEDEVAEAPATRETPRGAGVRRAPLRRATPRG